MEEAQQAIPAKMSRNLIRAEAIRFCRGGQGRERVFRVIRRAEDKTAHGNLFFNNVTRYNRRDGIRAGNRYGNENYFTQCVIGQNVEADIAPHAGAIFFNAIQPKKP